MSGHVGASASPNKESSTFSTRDGVGLEFNAERWRFVSNGRAVDIDFQKIEHCCQTALLGSIRRFCRHALQSKASITAQNYFYHICSFLSFCFVSRATPLVVVDEEDILNYKEQLEPRKKWYLGTLSAALRQMHELGYGGLTLEAYTLLCKLKNPGNKTGEAVQTFDPERGPFSDVELYALAAALHRGFNEEAISLEDYVLCWLFMTTGRRPLQIAALKLKDFKVTRAKDGTQFFTLNVPRAKQKGLGVRDAFKPVKLSPQVGELVEMFVQFRHFSDKMRLGDEAPLFLGREKGGGPGLEWHWLSWDLYYKVKAVFDALEVISPRTGEPMRVHPRRFRYSLGTRAAADGAGKYVIAELLDQLTTATAEIYVRLGKELLAKVNEVLLDDLTPIAQGFLGLLRDREADALRGDDPSSRISDPQYLSAPVGTCGSYSLCRLRAPIACYTCIHFQPWLDGPHEEMLARLKEEREELVDRTGGIRIAAINDRTILHVEAVILACEMRRELLIEDR